jgi:hypothetical protein
MLSIQQDVPQTKQKWCNQLDDELESSQSSKESSS